MACIARRATRWRRGIAPHDRHREPTVDDRGRTCGKVFNLYSGNALARRSLLPHTPRHDPARLLPGGHGVREVHSNRIEGFWLGLRNDLRPFRGVNKGNLDLYLAFYLGMHNFRRDVLGFIRQLLRPITPEGT